MEAVLKISGNRDCQQRPLIGFLGLSIILSSKLVIQLWLAAAKKAAFHVILKTASTLIASIARPRLHAMEIMVRSLGRIWCSILLCNNQNSDAPDLSRKFVSILGDLN